LSSITDTRVVVVTSLTVDLRLRNLAQLDARAVPLPHGTEVVTRVDRIVGERRVPQGSVGRVSRADGEDLDVTIVGVGVVRYTRDELTPRRVGQVLFAHLRSDRDGEPQGGDATGLLSSRSSPASERRSLSQQGCY
jgi:hypothetical protein